MPEKKLTDEEFEQMVNELPVYGSPDDFPAYRQYVADCMGRNEEPANFSEWRDNEALRNAA